MLEYLLLTFGLIALYCAMTALNVWILSGIPFVRKTAGRCWRWFERINDKIDEATGYYETWRQ